MESARIRDQYVLLTDQSHDDALELIASEHWVATFQRDILPGIVRERITPESLGMVLRPPEPEDPEVKANHQGANAGREYWTGWVCHGCGCASERKKWYGWNCEACKVGTKP